MKLCRQHFEWLFSICNNKTSNRPSLKHAFKSLGLDYPYTESKENVRPLEVVMVTRNPNGHDYNLKFPILALAQMVDDNSLLCHNCSGIQRSIDGELHLGNWLPIETPGLYKRLLPKDFLDSVPVGPVDVYGDWDSYGGSHIHVRNLLQTLSLKEAHAIH